VRDLNLGPDTKRLIERFGSMKIEGPPGKLAMLTQEMRLMLERWLEVGWCWPDACPATICGGPHVKVRYTMGRLTEVIEPADKVGETFPDVPHTVIKHST
jgi:hypothetical protein